MEQKELAETIAQEVQLASLLEAKKATETMLRRAEALLADGCGETAAQRAALKERHDERVLELANRAETAERRTAALEAQHAEQQHEKLNEKLAVLSAEKRAADVSASLSEARWATERSQHLERISHLEEQLEQLDVVRLARDELNATR